MERRSLSAVRCQRLAMQGFNDLDVATLTQLAPWLRFTPVLCGVGIALGTIFASVPVLSGMAILAILGAILPWHPFDLLYNYVVRFVTRTPALPRNRAPRRLAMGFCAVCLTATTVAFATGATILGYVLGGMTLIGPIMVTTTDLCLPSLLYGHFRPTAPVTPQRAMIEESK
ncbi:MAG: DUF4395 family protein [Thermomicrobiales bacterium]